MREMVPPASGLDEPLQFIKGVGPQLSAILGRLGLFSVGDLLHHYPRRWEDRTRFVRIGDVRAGEYVTVSGVVIAASTSYPKPKLPITRVILDSGGSALTLVWFNQPHLEKTFKAVAVARRPIVAYGMARANGW